VYNESRKWVWWKRWRLILGIIPEFSEGTRKNQKILNENRPSGHVWRAEPPEYKEEQDVQLKKKPFPWHKGIQGEQRYSSAHSQHVY
jgi:hypothetical protein